MAINKISGQIRSADLARGRVINRQKLAELETVRDMAKPKQKSKPAPKTGRFV